MNIFRGSKKYQLNKLSKGIFIAFALTLNHSVFAEITENTIGSQSMARAITATPTMPLLSVPVDMPEIIQSIGAINRSSAYHLNDVIENNIVLFNGESVDSLDGLTDKHKGISLISSNVGQKYTGSNSLSVYGWMNLGTGKQIDGVFTHSFPSLDKDSKGGKFNSSSISYKQKHSFGMAGVQFNEINYKYGGKYSNLGLSGEIYSLDFLNHHILNEKNSLFMGLHFKNNKQHVGVYNLSDKQEYQYLSGNGIYFDSYQGIDYLLNIGFEKGIGGSRDISHNELMGKFNPHFSSLKLSSQATYEFDNHITLYSKFGYQNSSKGTPLANTLYLGGADRGRAYEAGFASVEKGFYFSNTLYFKTIEIGQTNIFTPYMGYEIARGKMNSNSVKVQSAFIGLLYLSAKDININVALAKEIAQDKSLNAPINRLNITGNWNF